MRSRYPRLLRGSCEVRRPADAPAEPLHTSADFERHAVTRSTPFSPPAQMRTDAAGRQKQLRHGEHASRVTREWHPRPRPEAEPVRRVAPTTRPEVFPNPAGWVQGAADYSRSRM